MKVVVITQGVSRILDPVVKSGHQVVGVIESASRGYREPSRLRSFVSGLVRRIRGQSSLAEYCAKRGLPYILFKKGSEESIKVWLKHLAPDVMVVFSMSQLLTEDVFSIPRLGTINLHPSFLPDYRGPNPDFWQYVDLEMNPGITVHFVDSGEDTGDIIAQERVHIPLGTRSPERLDKLVGGVGVRLLLQTLNQFSVGRVNRVKQAVPVTRRARSVKANEHTELIDWSAWPIERIWHILRGTESWLNAVPAPGGLWRGQRWIIQEYAHGPLPEGYVPGQVYRENGKYFIACRDGRIYIKPGFKLSVIIKFMVDKLL